MSAPAPPAAAVPSSNAAVRAALGTLGPRSNWPVFKMKVRASMQAEGLLHVLDAAAAQTQASSGAGSSGGSSSSKVKSHSDAEADAEEGDKKSDAQGEYSTHNARVYAILVLCLDDAMAQLVMHEAAEGDGAGVWRALLRYFERQTMASKFHTRQLLHKCKMAGGEEFDTFKARVQQLAARLQSNGEPVRKES